MLTIILADSRGRSLDTVMENENILVSAHSGANLLRLAHIAIQIISRYSPDVILIMGGINNITRLNRQTRRVSLISNSRASLINHLISKLNEAKSVILSSHPSMKIAFGGIIGINLNAYNRQAGVHHNQWIVNDAITAVNSYIRQMNNDSGIPHPRLTSKVHTWRNGQRKHVYTRLYDGLHPGDLVLMAWARQIRLFHLECVHRFLNIGTISRETS